MNEENQKTDDTAKDFHCGFVAIFGRTNTGKSTLLNKLLGSKLSITSSKPQTTRNRITGLSNGEGYQIIYIDTPGVGMAKGVMGSQLVKIAYSSLNGTDIVLIVMDGKSGIKAEDEKIIERAGEAGAIVYLIINKIDLLAREKLLPLISSLQRYAFVKEFIPLSAKTGLNVDKLLECIIRDLPQAPKYFNNDALTDRPEEFVFSEFIREKIYRLVEKEIPYSTLVEVIEIKEKKEGFLYVQANIYVEKESQKGILVGKNGEMIKKIGMAARNDIEEFSGCKAFLDLYVRIKPRWTSDINNLHIYGYTTDEN